MHIRIFQEETSKFSIHSVEELISNIANFLHNKDYCRVTNVLNRAVGHSAGSGHFPEAYPTKWHGLIDGYIIDNSLSVKDIVELLSKEFGAPLYIIKENYEYLITDEEEEDAIF
ncbi:hypothetical protein [Paenibacillus tyrfis]|uniref:Uncharacterized protein n=1 Tax=Paenibacillus tyrfis TaxID=1501230 RepID=A0A081NV55_9BACL|nr:hypothetical protein [Paenibacillus tyrfis]KEQ22328.1 hypothetical protein ET33_26540 [Paenibacillus tyrfis]